MRLDAQDIIIHILAIACIFSGISNVYKNDQIDKLEAENKKIKMDLKAAQDAKRDFEETQKAIYLKTKENHR